MTTLREHLEAIIFANEIHSSGAAREAYVHAVAALAILEKSQHQYQCINGCWDCVRIEPMRSTDIRIALVPDPQSSATDADGQK